MIWDVLRISIIALGFILGAANVSVLLMHYKAWIQLKDRKSEAGLLPLHVATIAASYGILTYAVVSGVVAQLGQGPNWRLPLYLVGFSLGLFALGVMATRQRRRITFCPPISTVTINEETETTQKD